MNMETNKQMLFSRLFLAGSALIRSFTSSAPALLLVGLRHGALMEAFVVLFQMRSVKLSEQFV